MDLPLLAAPKHRAFAMRVFLTRYFKEHLAPNNSQPSTTRAFLSINICTIICAIFINLCNPAPSGRLTPRLRDAYPFSMRRGSFVLLLLLGAFPFSAVAQVILYFPQTDHSWVIKYSTNKFGLEQTTYSRGTEHYTETAILLGSRSWSYRTTVWPFLVIIAVGLAPFIWLLVYGIGSLAKPAKKPPPPNPSPPL